MKLFETIHLMMIERALMLGAWRWLCTALLCLFIFILWAVFVFFPLYNRLEQERSIPAQQSLIEKITHLEQQERNVQQEFDYMHQAVHSFEHMLQRSTDNVLSCLLSHAQTHGVELLNYQPCESAEDKQDDNFYLCQHASVEGVGSYPKMYAYLTSLAQTHPYVHVSLQSLVADEENRVRATLHVRMVQVAERSAEIIHESL